MKNIALIIAGGIGNRMGQDIPKQFMYIEDCPVIIRTMMAFQRHPQIDEINVVCLLGWETILRSYANQYQISKLNLIIPGGDCGQASIRNGIFGMRDAGYSPDDIILIHDAVRPLISQEIISSNIATCMRYGNAITSIRCAEAILESDDHHQTERSIPRDKLFRTQTPQSFRLSELVKAHEEALEKGITNSVATCTLMVELGGLTLYIAPGEERNIKLTNAEDVALYKSLLHTSQEAWMK